jgi:hypothetical protein
VQTLAVDTEYWPMTQLEQAAEVVEAVEGL